jgi:hypothetical protein
MTQLPDYFFFAFPAGTDAAADVSPAFFALNTIVCPS